MTKRPGPQHNLLLSLLPPKVFTQLQPHLEWVHLERDRDLYGDVKKGNYIYFPVTSIIALVNILLEGAAPEVAIVGMDGVVDSDLFFGYFSDTKRSLVQSAGGAYRIKTPLAVNFFNENQDFKILIFRYSRFLFSQASQIAVCNRFHSVEQQVCRFLLNNLDRWNSHRISLTHLRVSNLLGVRRATVSEVFASLAKKDIIHYHRGCVTVLDKTRLAELSCECYAVIKKELKNIKGKLD